MQNKRFYAVLVLAAGIVLAALHVADLLQWMDASTGFALQGCPTCLPGGWLPSPQS